MNTEYKTVWTEHDFDEMNWHDVMIHALSIITKEYDYELLFDVDYIFEWIAPLPPEKFFSFIVAPATICFSGVWDIETNIVTRKNVLEPISIAEIQRTNERLMNNSGVKIWDWIITLHQGSIKFSGTGYTQHIRRRPTHTNAQSLEEEQRGPLSFDKEYIDA